MATKTTLADYITESELWPASKERLDLVKECDELKMLEIYATAEQILYEKAQSAEPDYVPEAWSLDLVGIFEKGTNTKQSTQESIAAAKEKVAAKKKVVLDRIISLLKAIGRVIVIFFDKLVNYFYANRGMQVELLEKEAAALIGKVESIKLSNIGQPEIPPSCKKDLQLISSVYDNSCTNIQKLNDTLRGNLTSRDFNTLKDNEKWLAPKLEVKAAKLVGEIDILMEEMQQIIEKINNLQPGASNALNVVKALDSLNARINDMTGDIRAIKIDVSVFQKKARTISTVNKKMNMCLDDLKKRFDTDNSTADIEYGKIFSAMQLSIKELRVATGKVMAEMRNITDRINAAIAFQRNVHFLIKEAISKS